MHKLQRAILDLARTQSLDGMNLTDIGKRIGEPHPQKIKHHLGQLRRKGFLTSDSKPVSSQTGSIKLNNLGLRSIPILGAANCGEADLFADESLEGFLQVSPSMVPNKKKLFAIRAIGHSMNRASIAGKTIEEGDFVIIDATTKKPRNGDYILSVIGGQANIKKFVEDAINNQIVLLSESSSEYPSIYIHPNDLEDYQLNGAVVTVIKKPNTDKS